METRNNSRFAAVVLAAGMSSRMGEAKQLLQLGDNTLLGQVLDNVRSSRVKDIVLVLGHEAEKIKERISTDNLIVVLNESYQQGMGTSLRDFGLAALRPGVDAALIILADQPFIRPKTLDLLMDQYMRSSAQIVIPTYKGFRGNPVLLDRSVFSEVMAITGDIGCRAIFGNHLAGIAKLPVGDIGILLDMDSKDDFELLNDFRNTGVTENVLIEVANRGGRDDPGADSAPGRELIIVGREPVGLALAKLGKLLQFRVTVVDPLVKPYDLPEVDRLLNSLDFSHLPAAPARYVVVASRGKFDEEAVEQALLANCDYVALVAKKQRAQEIRHSLQLRGESPEKLAMVRAPAGLNIGAEGPEEIALSIMAEIVAESRSHRERKSAAGS